MAVAVAAVAAAAVAVAVAGVAVTMGVALRVSYSRYMLATIYVSAFQDMPTEVALEKSQHCELSLGSEATDMSCNSGVVSKTGVIDRDIRGVRVSASVIEKAVGLVCSRLVLLFYHVDEVSSLVGLGQVLVTTFTERT